MREPSEDWRCYNAHCSLHDGSEQRSLAVPCHGLTTMTSPEMDHTPRIASSFSGAKELILDHIISSPNCCALRRGEFIQSMSLFFLPILLWMHTTLLPSMVLFTLLHVPCPPALANDLWIISFHFSGLVFYFTYFLCP